MLCNKTKTRFALSVLIGILGSNTIAFAAARGSHTPGFSMSVIHGTVNDDVAYSPNLPAGGFAPAQNKARFNSNRIKLSYSTSVNSRIDVGLGQLRMTSLRDEFVINSLKAGIQRTVYTSVDRKYGLDLGLFTGFNYATQIHKNSYTNFGDQLITDVRLLNPRDYRLTLAGKLGVVLTDQLQLTVELNGGSTRTTQRSIKGMARLSNNCRFQFNANESSATVRQLDSCGRLQSFERQYNSDNTLTEELGFSVARDISYTEYFAGTRVALTWRKDKLRLKAGYAARGYNRPTLDSRIRNSGDQPVTSSQQLDVGVYRDIFDHWQISTGAIYQKSAFLDDVPFLYSALTNQRYQDKNVLRFQFELRRQF